MHTYRQTDIQICFQVKCDWADLGSQEATSEEAAVWNS